MANTALLRKRIKSVGSIHQITKAMEMVAAAKMRRAVERRSASVAYAKEAFSFLQNLVASVETDAHPLLEGGRRFEPVSDAVLAIVVASDRGLAGSFNTNILREALKLAVATGKKISFITVGKKIRDGLKRNWSDQVIADFPGLGDQLLGFAQTTPIARLAMQQYLAGEYSKVMLVSTEFISSLAQRAHTQQLLPIERIQKLVLADSVPKYRFEPSRASVLDAVLKRLIEVQVFQALVESNASEHSARMLSMKNATDAAGDLIDDLALTYNQERQAGITRELSEITAGSEALKGIQ